MNYDGAQIFKDFIVGNIYAIQEGENSNERYVGYYSGLSSTGKPTFTNVRKYQKTKNQHGKIIESFQDVGSLEYNANDTGFYNEYYKIYKLENGKIANENPSIIYVGVFNEVNRSGGKRKTKTKTKRRKTRKSRRRRK